MPPFIDITAPLTEDMPLWPGTRPVKFTATSSMATGDAANSHLLDIPNHVGTHMDAPYHFVADGERIDAFPLDIACGKAQVIELPARDSISLEQIQQAGILPETQRLLIKTPNSEEAWWKQPFKEKFVHLSTEAAEWLATTSVRLIGVDYLSVSGYNSNEIPVHQALLGKGIWIVEGLMLKEAAAGFYQLYCLPLKLKGLDGSPCRAILEQEVGKKL